MEPKNFKDRLSPALFERLGRELARHAPLELSDFLADLEARGAYALPLKDRVHAAAEALVNHLPPYERSVEALILAAPAVGMWENWVLTDIVQHHGLGHFELSVDALRRLTPHGTGEFAVRPYINRYMERMLPVLHAWAEDDNEHVRRLAAEGTRPRGVWMEHVPAFRRDPAPVVALLDRLRADPSLYVRKAVANNLNDISKDHPDVALAVAARWRQDGDPRTDWIIARGLRTLLKQGEGQAQGLVGRQQGVAVRVASFEVEPGRPRIGGEIRLSCALVSEVAGPTPIALDYRVHFFRPGGRSSAKVFQWSRRTVGPGERLSLSARQALRDLSTRKHHPGPHRVELLINGVALAEAGFELLPAEGA